jgi:hypothetical protein
MKRNHRTLCRNIITNQGCVYHVSTGTLQHDANQAWKHVTFFDEQQETRSGERKLSTANGSFFIREDDATIPSEIPVFLMKFKEFQKHSDIIPEVYTNSHSRV